MFSMIYRSQENKLDLKIKIKLLLRLKIIHSQSFTSKSSIKTCAKKLFLIPSKVLVYLNFIYRFSASIFANFWNIYSLKQFNLALILLKHFVRDSRPQLNIHTQTHFGFPSIYHIMFPLVCCKTYKGLQTTLLLSTRLINNCHWGGDIQIFTARIFDL